MVVGICRVVLALPYNDSLKGKRSVVKSIIERSRSRFHVAAAEVDDLDVHRRATLGFAAVSNDGRHLRSVMDKLTAFVASATEAQLLDRQVRIEHYDLGAPDGGFDALSWGDDGDEEE